jgi:hypothetical protein
MKFPTNVCPLCDTVLKLRRVAGVSVFECPTQAEGLVKPKSHYEVELDKQAEIQHIVVMPYAIDTFGNASRSRVYRMVGLEEGQQKWRLMMEVPVIRAEAQDKLLERLNKLAIFL